MRQKYTKIFAFLLLLCFCTNTIIYFSYLPVNNNTITLIEEIPLHLETSNGGTYFIAGSTDEIYDLDPVEAWDSGSYNVINQVVERLFAYNLSDPDLPRLNLLAESYWWVNDTSFQVKLREGIQFHDGTPFNASAAKWNLDRLLYLTNCTGTNMGDVAITETLWFFPDGVTPIISGVSTVGNWNITITLNAPYSSLIDLLAFVGASMLSPTSTPATQFIDLYTEPLVGTGPFVYDYYSSGVEVHFTRWNSYWRTPAYFEDLTIEYFSDSTILNDAMLSHSIDYCLNPLYSYFPSYDADSDVTLKRYSDDTGKAGFVYNFLGFNNLLYNVTWRKVMSMAINYTYMLDELLFGNSMRANSPISPGFGDAYNASTTGASFDIATARTIMKSMGFGVGFTMDSEWIAVADGPSPFLTLNFSYNIGNLFREDMYYLLSNDFKLLGIKLEEAALSWPDYIDRLFNINDGWNKLNLWTSGWLPDYLDAFMMLYPLFTPGSLGNGAQVDDPWLNSQLSLALNTTDYTTRMNIYKDLQWYISEFQYFHAPLYHPKEYFVHLTEIEGVPYNIIREFYVYPMFRSTPSSFVLSSNAGTPDDDGIFDLNWTASSGANNYSVYEYSGYITEINGSLTLLASEITELGLALSSYSDGTYYFIVVAHNDYGSTLSNCIGITIAIPLDHDLEVSIDLPTSINVNTSYIVSASVKNTGLNTESGVELYFYLDEVLINSTIIPSLAVGQNASIQYNWTPSEYRSYNFTAYAPPVSLETYLDNNVKTVFVYVVPANWLDDLYIKYIFGQMGSGYNVQFSYTPHIGGLYNVTFAIEGMGAYIWQIDPGTRIMSGGALFGDGYHTPEWIFTNTSLYDTIPIAVDGEGDHDFYVARDLVYDLPGFGLIEVWELEDLTDPGGLAWYEKSTGILITGNFLYGGGMSSYSFEFIDTNAVFSYIVYDHEIRVTLDLPLNVELNTLYLVNATVENNGLYDELGVDLFLYLNDVIVDSTTISNLSVGMSYSIQYSWTPTNYGEYNFTAIAPVVPSETYIANNKMTIFRYVIDTEIFDGLYIKHTFNSGAIYNTNTTYSYYDGRSFYETWTLEYMGTAMSYSWLVNALTRVMIGISSFGNGSHTPMWIFTNVSLYDTVSIGIFGDVDHDFYVARLLVYVLPGFGSVEVWELEDLDQPGGIAWYEKSTGILLNGTFLSEGMGSYSFGFVDTNAPMTIIGGESPGDFTLSSNAGDPDSDGNFDITWTASSDAEDYTAYRSSSFITEITGSLTLLANNIVVLSMAINNYADGTYYFIVVAHNVFGDTLSNCIVVTVLRSEVPPGPGISGYNSLLLVAALGVTIAVVIKKKYQKK